MHVYQYARRYVGGAILIVGVSLSPSLIPSRSTDVHARSLPSSSALRQVTGGSVAAWGWNEWGQLDPRTCCNFHPTPVPGLAQIVSIAGGERETVAARSGGSVLEWGQIRVTPDCSYTCGPVAVFGLHRIIAVAAGFSGAKIALDADGKVWTWRRGSQERPVQVAGLPKVTQIAAGGSYALALTSDGAVWEWLDSNLSSTSGAAPYPVSGLNQVKSIAAGYNHRLAIRTDGTVWTWGYAGHLSSGSPQRIGVTAVPGPNEQGQLTHAVAVAAGLEFSLVVRSDGSVWSWGRNPYGELGTGSKDVGARRGSDVPVRVAGLPAIVAVAAGALHSLALDSRGKVWGWGENDRGQVGLGVASVTGCRCIARPVQVKAIKNAVSIAAGYAHSLAITGTPVAGPVPPPTRACSPLPVRATPGQRLPATVKTGRTPTGLVVAEGTGHVYLTRAGGYDAARGAYSCTGSVTALDARTGAVLWTTPVSAEPRSFVASATSHRLFVVDDNGPNDRLRSRVRILNAGTGRAVRTVSLGQSPGAMALADRANRLFITVSRYGVPGSDHIQVLDAATGSPVGDVAVRGVPVVAEDLGRVFVQTPGSIAVLDIRTGRQIGSIDSHACPGTLFLAGTARRLYTAMGGDSHGGHGVFCVINAQSGTLIRRVSYPPAEGAEAAIVDSPQNRILVIEGTAGPAPYPGIEVRDAHDGRLLRRLPLHVSSAAVDEQTGRIYFLDDSRRVGVLDPRTGQVVRQIQTPANVTLLALGQRARRLYLLDSRGGTLHVLCADVRCR
ncbi:MAG: hypothetical protein PVSMB7_08530 [Chloroflexota bacterium]